MAAMEQQEQVPQAEQAALEEQAVAVVAESLEDQAAEEFLALLEALEQF
jgi:hypothetical protein